VAAAAAALFHLRAARAQSGKDFQEDDQPLLAAAAVAAAARVRLGRQPQTKPAEMAVLGCSSTSLVQASGMQVAEAAGKTTTHLRLG
jgi:hypothetical protein